MIEYVTFMPIPDRSRVKVFIKQKFHGYLETSKLFMIFTPEERAVYAEGQIKLVVEFNRFKPYLVKP